MMKNLALSLLAMIATLLVTTAAEARKHQAEQPGVTRQSAQPRVHRVKSVRHYRKSYRGRHASYRGRYASYRGRYAARSMRSYRAHRVARTRDTGESFSLSSLSGYGVGPRPRQWCGWWMRTQLGGGPTYNLAWSWSRYGSPSSAHVGAIVVWRHHVGMITGQASNGQWIVKSGNDGGRVRERARSVSGAVFRA